MNEDILVATKEWWTRVLSSDLALTAWLQKLQLTEISGHDDHLVFMKNNVMAPRETTILTNIALDELKHSNLLIELMRERGIPLKKLGDEGTISYYWTRMNQEVKNVQDYCAVNYFGESLAADRFAIIHAMPETPSDIKEFISKALPDEIFHRETLQRLAGTEALERLQTVHDETFTRLLNK
jgi:tRNA isopentenyl-2-thiomethyl-A-37 hydroxylase MiaE